MTPPSAPAMSPRSLALLFVLLAIPLTVPAASALEQCEQAARRPVGPAYVELTTTCSTGRPTGRLWLDHEAATVMVWDTGMDGWVGADLGNGITPAIWVPTDVEGCGRSVAETADYLTWWVGSFL